MTKLELKKLIKETILNEMVNTHPVHKSINNKLMQIANREKMNSDEDKVVGYVFWDKPEDPENYLQTRVYLNKKTGERYVKQVGDGVGEDLNQPPND